MPEEQQARRIVLIVHYFPPINSSGAKRMEAMSKYFVRAGRSVTVITTKKRESDGAFTERLPEGVVTYQIDWRGRVGESVEKSDAIEYSTSQKGRFVRKIKDAVMRWFGQLPDPRLPFAFAFLSPGLDESVKQALKTADIVVGTTPPWPTLLAALFTRWRFGLPVVLDYRDHFSHCHEMPGGRIAKKVEEWVDRALARRAKGLVVISEPMVQYYRELNPRVAVILNGYDPEVIEEVRRTISWAPRAEGAPMILRYLGIITLGRIPRNLLAALQSLKVRGLVDRSKIVFEYYGECALLEVVLAEEYSELRDLFIFKPRVSYRESLALVLTADYVLFCENAIKAKTVDESISARGVLTTKLFEYLASGRPILADISPDTLAGEHILKAGGMHIVRNSPEAFEQLLVSPQFWNPAASREEHPFVKTLSRSAQAKQYLQELDAICQT